MKGRKPAKMGHQKGTSAKDGGRVVKVLSFYRKRNGAMGVRTSWERREEQQP